MEYTYQEARRSGMRCYRDKIARGEYPYLQVLDEITRHSGVISEQYLGIQEIPTEMRRDIIPVPSCLWIFRHKVPICLIQI